MRNFIAAVVAFVFCFSKGFGNDVPDGAIQVPNKEAFLELSALDDTPGAIGIHSLKFLITGVDTQEPQIYFINTNRYPYHYNFADGVLKLGLTLQQFNRKTYFTDNRSYLAGVILAHENFVHPNGKKGAYVFEFWPTDPVKVQFTGKAFSAIAEGMPFASDRLYYHPSGETHSELLEAEREEYERQGIPILTSEVLFENLSFSPLNLGEGYGYLRVADPTTPVPYTVRDVVIFKSIPNELSHVAGVITEEPQTPLCHINLKAKQNKTPNAFLKGASTRPEIHTLIGKPVYFRVTAEGVELRPATPEEIEQHLEKIRPSEVQYPVRNLSITRAFSLEDVGNAHASIFGAKAANVGELKSFLPEDGLVPDGFALPFYFYHTFMLKAGLYGEARQMMEDPEFKSSPEKRELALKAFRKKIKKTDMPQELQVAIDAMWANFPEGRPLRCRSSTNNEDLPGFNGAGLYDSCTHREDEGNISKSIKQVFASLWNFRAFEEREFYRIDHFKTAMGVMIHPNFDDELSNGVAITKNPYDENWGGFYINVQVGEALVTNPDPGAVPDEFLVMKTAISHEEEGLETIYIRHSSLVEKGETVMDEEQIHLLAEKLEKIQNHFKNVYRGGKGFAMDVEFKIDKDGNLVIKQARPWVD